jgi:hypothetical protein
LPALELHHRGTLVLALAGDQRDAQGLRRLLVGWIGHRAG